MNNTIKLAVASALLAAASSASAAGGIVAGDWTLDIGGVVNAYYTSTKTTGLNDVSNITTGLLQNYITFSGKTRQNDLDVTFLISLQPGAAQNHAASGGSANESRQAFLTFGDASWGSVKLGKDLGIYASDAILNDMTLLGVGSNAASVSTTTLGRIGTGYQYADWKSQVAYTTPNYNGFSATVGVTQAWQALTDSTTAVYATRGKEPAFEGKASYAFAGDVSGKVWVSGITQKVELSSTLDRTASAWDLGANVNMAGMSLTGYYGEGKGTGSTFLFLNGFDTSANKLKRDNEDWFVQATYTLPGVGTKLGASYGESTNKGTTANANAADKATKDMWVVGAYHPLTKHLNLVAEYSDTGTKATQASATSKAETVSLGAILFF